MERNSTNDMSDADETEAAFDLILNETGGNDPAQFKGNFFLILLFCSQFDQVKCICRNHLAQNNFSRTRT